MKQNIFKKLMLIALLLTSNAIWAYDFESGGIYYNILSETDKTVEVTIGDNLYTSSVIIPKSVNHNNQNYSVTSIGDRAFYNHSALTSITIAEGVTSIGDNAFYKCTDLTYIELPSTISSIGNNAFLTEYDYFRTIKCNAKTPPILGYDAFHGNNITLEVPFESVLAYQANTDWNPSTQEYMPYYSITYQGKEFDGIYYLPKSDTEVKVVSNPSKYTDSVVIPAEIKIGEKTFKVTSIEGAFNKCTDLTSVTIPEGVTYIGSSAFSGCTGLTTITIPNSVTSIGYNAFSGCTGLTTITIPNSVTSIGSSAFYSCI